MKWQRVMFKNFIQLQRGFDLPKSFMKEGEVPVLGSNCIIGYHNEARVAPPGVVTGRSGTLGLVQYTDSPYWPHNTALWVKDFKGNHPRFVFYKLQTLNLEAFNGGVSVPTLNRNVLDDLEVSIPNHEAQKQIAEILSAYDDLIENNRRRMALLEQAAQQLYSEWFVRLRFPGHEHTRITNGVPERWERVPLGEISTKIGSGFTPRGGESSYLSEGTPLIRSLNVYDDLFLDEGLAFVSEDHAAALAGVTVESKDILLNITGASVARSCMAPERYLPARVNQHVMIIRIDPEMAEPFFVHKAINSDERKRQLLSYAQKGATREALTKEMVASFEITLPSDALMRQFGEIAGLSFRQRETLALQNRKLRAARDLLLPRLMSEEIAV
jgi:type I restriction enzyme S subunit